MRVLVAVDIHHESAHAVVAQAARWAAGLKATLDVAFADEYEYSAYLVRDPAIRDIVVRQWDKIRGHNRAELNRLLEDVPAEIRGQVVYLQGRAADELVTAAAGYDALLVATHGRVGLGHFFLGSVAERVIRRATVPVVVLRLPSPEAGGSDARA